MTHLDIACTLSGARGYLAAGLHLHKHADSSIMADAARKLFFRLASYDLHHQMSQKYVHTLLPSDGYFPRSLVFLWTRSEARTMIGSGQGNL